MDERENAKETEERWDNRYRRILETVASPPEEHAHELKMEKRLKRMLKEQEKKKGKRTLS